MSTTRSYYTVLEVLLIHYRFSAMLALIQSYDSVGDRLALSVAFVSLLLYSSLQSH